MTKLGIGWRPEIARMIEKRDDLDFVEIVAENWSPDHPPQALVDLHERGVQVIPHGISLSLGSAELPDLTRLQRLNAFASRFGSPFVSEHVAFVRGAGLESGHLLPVPRTEAATQVLIENILFAKKHLTVPLVLENIAYLCEWGNSEMSEPEFIREILEATDSMMLLDVANLVANAINHDFDPIAYLRRIPLDRVAYVHIAGGIVIDGIYHDTHAHPVSPTVLDVVSKLTLFTAPPMVMLERDDLFPNESVINMELDAIKHAVQPKLIREAIFA